MTAAWPVRSLRRFRKKLGLLAGTSEILRKEPSSWRSARQLLQASVRLGMTPTEILTYELHRRSVPEVREFLSKRSLTGFQSALSPKEQSHLVANKLHYHAACKARNVAAPPLLAIVDFGCDDDFASALTVPRIRGEADIASFLSTLPPGKRIAFKAFEGSYGRGFLGLVADAGGAIGPDGRRLDCAALWRYCCDRRSAKGFLVQPWLEPDPALRPIMPGRALGTVRLVTVLIGRDVECPYASVKIPVGGNITDNFGNGATGNLSAYVDAADGTVGVAWGRSATQSHRLEPRARHPDSGVPIEGFRIPHWGQVLELAAQAARAFPELRTLGWDVAITTEGIFLLEGNRHWDPEAPQISLQRGIRSEMEALVARATASAH